MFFSPIRFPGEILLLFMAIKCSHLVSVSGIPFYLLKTKSRLIGSIELFKDVGAPSLNVFLNSLVKGVFSGPSWGQLMEWG